MVAAMMWCMTSTGTEEDEFMGTAVRQGTPAGQDTPAPHHHGRSWATELSIAEARAERDAVLHQIGGDSDGLRARLDAEGLTGWELSLLTELEALEDRLSA